MGKQTVLAVSRVHISAFITSNSRAHKAGVEGAWFPWFLTFSLKTLQNKASIEALTSAHFKSCFSRSIIWRRIRISLNECICQSKHCSDCSTLSSLFLTLVQQTGDKGQHRVYNSDDCKVPMTRIWLKIIRGNGINRKMTLCMFSAREWIGIHTVFVRNVNPLQSRATFHTPSLQLCLEI